MQIDSSKKEIRAIFKTDIQEIKIKETGTILIDTSLTKEDLNKMIKKLTKYKGPKSFEFLIEGKLLPGVPLRDFLSSSSISTEEKTLEVVFLFQMEEPKLIDSTKQNEWIRHIRRFSDKHYCIGLFNSEFNIYTSPNSLVTRIEANEDEPNFLNDFTVASPNPNSTLLVYSNRDDSNAFRIKEIQQDSDKASESSLIGRQTNPALCIAHDGQLNPNFLLCGSSDGTLSLYKLPSDYTPEGDHQTKSSKRRKIEKQQQQLFPVNDLSRAHSLGISKARWLNSFQAVTCGDDHLVKLWNVNSFAPLVEMKTDWRVVTCLSNLGDLVLCGLENGVVRVYDPRLHSSSVAYVQAHGYSTGGLVQFRNGFVSGGFDGKIKVWDLRSLSAPLRSFEGTNRKVFALEVLQEVLLAGGDESTVDSILLDRD